MSTDLRKSFDTTFDNLRSSFAGLSDHSSRVIYGVELATQLQESLWAYVMNEGPKPTLHVENAAYGRYGSVNGESEGDFPRVVQQQANINGKGEDIVPAIESEWANDPDTPARSLRDKITDVMRDREAG